MAWLGVFPNTDSVHFKDSLHYLWKLDLHSHHDIGFFTWATVLCLIPTVVGVCARRLTGILASVALSCDNIPLEY